MFRVTPTPLIITDAAINIAPTLKDKVHITQNAIDLAHALGQKDVRVAILSAMESVNPDVPSTLEAAALCKMADRGQITGAVLDGPLALDNAISPEAAAIKKIVSPVAGRANVIVVPDLEAGNMLAKSLSFLAGADAAGIVLGAQGSGDPDKPRGQRDRASRFLRGRNARGGIAAGRRFGGDSVMAGAVNNIAVFNAGSSSIKFAIFDKDDPDGILFKGQFENIGVAPRLSIDDGGGGVLFEQEWEAKEIDHGKATTIILETAIGLLGGRAIPAIGHRVVHGGTKFAAPVLINSDVIAELEKLTPLAPLHQPHNLTPIKAIAASRAAHPPGRLFRYRFSPVASGPGANLRDPAKAHRVRNSALWLPWPVLRICERPAC